MIDESARVDPQSSDPAPTTDRAPLARPLPRALLIAFDVVVSVGLAVFSFAVRKDGLPTDGLWFDDSWVAAGARAARPSNLMITGSGHPGFTALLAVVERLVGGATALGWPALVVGSLSATGAYWFVRAMRLSRGVALLLAAVLAVAPIHITYSSRVKGYVFDTVLVAILALLVAHLARRRWTWGTAAGWLAFVLLAGTMSGYVLVATAFASLVLALHGREDRLMRTTVLIVQGAAQLGYFLVARSKTDLDGIEKVMETAFDGHMTFYANPIDFIGETLKHLHRVGEVYPSGPDGLITAIVVASLVGLAGAALAPWSRLRVADPVIVASRYLLTLVTFAFAGSLVDRFPFGTNNINPLSYGGRHTLWLVPALVLGLGVVLGQVWSSMANGSRLRRAANVAIVAASIAILVHGERPEHPHPQAGSEKLVAHLEANLGPDDVVLVTSTWTFLYMYSTSTPVELVATPDHQVGFAPRFTDERIHAVGQWASEPATPDHLNELVDGAERVLVVGGGWYGGKGVETVNGLVADEGFEQQHRVTFDQAHYDVWVR